MKVVFSEPYSYLLVQEEGDWFLTFFTGGPVEIDICVKLTDEEIEAVSTSQVKTAQLVQAFQQNRSLFDGRRIIPSVAPKRNL